MWLGAAPKPGEPASLLGDLCTGPKIDSLVDVRHPIDVTPTANDPTHEEVMPAFLEDPGVDLARCAPVPLTLAMGLHLAEMSNRGYEAVGIADSAAKAGLPQAKSTPWRTRATRSTSPP